jgi:hypothetical protein
MGGVFHRAAASFRHAVTLARVWGTTELTLWPNRFHVVFAAMVTMMFAGNTLSQGFSVPSFVVMAAVDGALVFRISLWNHDRLSLHD